MRWHLYPFFDPTDWRIGSVLAQEAGGFRA